jgi:hypothetical protein
MTDAMANRAAMRAAAIQQEGWGIETLRVDRATPHGGADTRRGKGGRATHRRTLPHRTCARSWPSAIAATLPAWHVVAGPVARCRVSGPGAGRSPGSPVLIARLPVVALRSKPFDSGARGDPHWLTVAGAAAGWRESTSRGTAFPFHPPRGIRGGHLRAGILRRTRTDDQFGHRPSPHRRCSAASCYNSRPFNDLAPASRFVQRGPPP